MFANFLVGQETLTLTFSGRRGDDRYQRLDYLTVRNTVRDWQDILYYPDTTFVINLLTSVDDFLDSDLIRVTPNPFHGESRIAVEMPLSSQLTISVYDLSGTLCARYQSKLAAGAYSFSLQLNKPNLYLLSVASDYSQYATKVISLGGNVKNEIELVSYNNDPRLIPAWDPTDHPFEFGDVMEYIGYIDDGNVLETSNIKIQPQYSDEDVILHFDALAPEVTTTAVSDISQNAAACFAEVTYDGGANVRERGVCWSTDPMPTIDGTHASCGEGTGSFSAQMTDLNVCTAYYVRSYAVNSVGIAYGNEISFTTTAFPPEVTTLDVTDITQTHATCGGVVTYDGGTSVIDRGICWSTDPMPTISNSHVSCGEGTGSFSAQMADLNVNTDYYVRSYAVNSAGIAYGNEICFTTAAFPPVVITSDVTDIAQTHATCGGVVTYDGGTSVIDRGICWSTEPTPTISNSHVSCGEGTGAFSGIITGLSINTTYYIRSYAVNSAGTSYGDELSFITPPIADIKLLSIGNSYSADALSYVPFILENMGVDANIQIGLLIMGGGTLTNHVDNFENQIPNYLYFIYEGGGSWQYRGQQTIQFALDDYEWDNILLQQVSYAAPNWSSYQPSLDTLIGQISNYLDYDVQFGWYMVQSRPSIRDNGPNYPDETIISRYSNIALNSQRVLNETACNFVVPVGTAIQNARTVPAIKALGDYANNIENTSGLGYLDKDGTHLQEGLPCQIAAYTFVLSILEQYGGLEAYSIIGESTRVTPEWMVGKNIPGINGTPVGSNDMNCLIGQQSAVEAFNNPFQITDMNKKLFKSSR